MHARVVARRRSSLRILLALSITIVLLLLPNAPYLIPGAASLIQQGRSQGQQRMGNPKRGKPEATLPNLETVRNETPVTRELPVPIPSTVRSKKIPLQPWDGRRVGEEHLPPRNVNNEEPRGSEGEVASVRKRGNTREHKGIRQTRRAHAGRLRPSAPPTVLDDTFIDNFYAKALPNYTPLSSEKPYWRDQMRAGYAQGQTSLTLAAREMGRTIFESAVYTEPDAHEYVGDLYWTYLMRDPNNDQGGWNFWTSMVSSIGRENVRLAFEYCDEFGVKMSEIVPNGSASGKQTSLITARVEPRNQPGGGLLTRDATWSVPLLSLPGRAGLDLGLGLSYSSQVWTTSGPFIYFDEDNGFPSPGFRLGFPTVQRQTFDALVGRNSYLLLTPGGHRVELRQVGTSNVYEAADSSYLQLTNNGSSLLVRSTDGTQLTYVEINGDFRCTQVKDRNGNFLTVNYNGLGRITTITDTLTRVITFNYDSNQNLLSITQAGKADPWVAFGWTNKTLGLSFSSSVAVIGTTATAQLPVINQVAVNDGSYFQFDYSNSLQVTTITRKSFDNVQRAQTNFTYQSPSSDAPRLTASSVSASNWTGINGVPSLVTTNYSVSGNTYSVTAPDGTVYSETYGTGWKKGLVTGTEIVSGGVVQKWTTTNWTQDDTSSSITWEINPRVTETNVYDAGGNRRKTTIDYHAQFGLPHVIGEWNASATGVLRYTYLDYKNDSQYVDRRIIGLIFRRTVKDGSYNTQSKVEYGYDWGSPYFEGLSATPTQHDGANYGTSFLSGRGNVSSIDMFDATDPENYNKIIQTKFGHNLTGSVIFTRDGLNHQSSVSYTDAFSAGGDRNTFAYPTTMTDADGFSSYAQYHFDFGATTRTQGPPPAGQSQGAIQDMVYNAKWQLERVTTVSTGAYQRFEYGPDFTKSFSTVNTANDEAYSLQAFDGLGRTITSGSNHPGSTGGYKAQITIYNQMGRAIKVSNPAETNDDWEPVGDDAGWLFTEQTYNWQGRQLTTTNQDATTKTAQYAGCGCAGGEVITVQDEVGRKQRLTSDILGRLIKAEVLNPNNTVYSSSVTDYNARDQVIAEKSYVGEATSDGSCPAGSCIQATKTYDGYGRVSSSQLPQQTSSTTYTYTADDLPATAIDPRGAVATNTYNNRHLLTGVAYSGTNAPAPVSFSYDAVGNRTAMSDGTGSVNYTRDQLSRVISEVRTFSGLSGSYTISYGYNLSNLLTSVTDPGGAQISYSYNANSQLNGMTSSGFSGVTQILSNMQYRASGGTKHATYGTNLQLNVAYNARMLISQFQVSGFSSTPSPTLGAAMSYADDGRMFTATDLSDSRFDLKYEFDFATRLQQVYSGAEAHGASAPPLNQADSPSRQTYTYDQWNNVTQRSGRTWTQFDWESASYPTNNKRNGWGYDAAGNVLATDDGSHSYDAAGRPIGFESYQTWKYYPDWPSTPADGPALVTSDTFDGAGQVAKRVKTTREDATYDYGYGPVYWMNEQTTTTYQVHSAVLGGKTIVELDQNGNKTIGYAYSGDSVVATQHVWTGSSYVELECENPVTGSTIVMDPFGGYGSITYADTVGRAVTNPPPAQLVPDEPFNKFLNEPMPIEYAPQWTGEMEQGMGQYTKYVAERTAIYIYNSIKRDFINALIKLARTGDPKYLTKVQKILTNNPDFVIGINGKWQSGKDASSALTGALAKLPGNQPASSVETASADPQNTPNSDETISKAVGNVLGIFLGINACATWFGSDGLEALNALEKKLSRGVIDGLGNTQTGIKMSGAETTFGNPVKYRVFQNAVINNNGPFFNILSKTRIGGYNAGTNQSRAIQILHELAHMVYKSGTPLIPNDYDPDNPGANKSEDNTKEVLKYCKKEVDAIKN